MKTNILTLVVVLTLGVILSGSLLLPVVEDAQTNFGDRTTVTNTGINTTPIEYWNGEELEYTYNSSTKAFTCNGESVTYARNQLIFSADTFSIWSRGTEAYKVVVLGDTAESYSDFTVTISSDGAYSITRGTSTFSGTVTWGVFQSATGTANLVEWAGGGFLTSTTDDVLIMGNLYQSGSNDTYYSYHDGILTVSDAYVDVSSVEITKTLKDGYIGVYTTSVQVNIGDESFAPYYVVVPKEVHGQLASGGAYDLLGAIPVIVIIGLVLAGCAAIFVKRED